MKSRLKTLAGYKEKMQDNNCYWLLQQIRAVTLQFDEKRNGIMSLLDARCSLLNCKQQQGESVNVYKETLKSWADAIHFHGGTVGERLSAVPDKDATGAKRTTAQRQEIATDETLAMLMIRGADPTRYGTLIAELSNQFAMGKDEYPKDLSAAESILELYETPANRPVQNYNRPGRGSPRAGTPEASAMTFAQRGNVTASFDERVAASIAGTDGVLHPGISCYGPCKGYGHYSEQCPSQTTTSVTKGTTLTQFGFMLAQSDERYIDPSCNLLDSQSTFSVFKNPSMLNNIRYSGRTLRAITNGGHQDSTLVGNFPNLGEVWFNRDSIANILSLAQVRKVCRVTMDSSASPSMCIHRHDGSVMTFTEHDSGLYIYDPNSVYNKHNDHLNIDVSCFQTVAEQKRMFSRRKIQGADDARELYRKLGRPSDADFQDILRNNLIRNCPVTPGDAQRAMVIYGPDIAVLKGKTTQPHAAPRAPTFAAVPLPPPITTHHLNVTLCIDIFYVQGISFLHTISRDIGFRTVHPILARTKAVLLPLLLAVIRLYHTRGFAVRDLHGDLEFECLRPDILPITMNLVAVDSHEGTVERSIRTIKERIRCCVHGLPFQRLPVILLRHLVADAVRCLNQFPWKLGISQTMSPAGIVLGHSTPDFLSLRLEFGTYVQVYEHNSPSNTPKARTLGAIALDPTGNAQGDYHFLSLASGDTVIRHSWTILPMTDTAIARVEAIALNDNQPLIQASGLVVEWRHDQLIDDSIYDRDYEPPPPVFDIPLDPLFEAIDPSESADLLHDAARFIAPLPVHDGYQGAAEHAHGHHDPNPYNQHDGEHDQHDGEQHDGEHDQHDGEYHDYENENENDPYIHEVHDNDNEPLPAIIELDDDLSHGEDQGASRRESGADRMYDVVHDGHVDDNAYNQNCIMPPATETITDEGAHEAPDTHVQEGANGGTCTNDEGRSTYNLRPRVDKHVTFSHAMDKPHSGKSYYPPTQLMQRSKIMDKKKFVFGHILTQMTAKAGIKKHGRAAEEALMQEFAQFEELEVYEAVDVNTLTNAQRRGALRAISLIKEKRDGRLKGRTVADGSVQRSLYDKSETASPTVSTDALMLSIMIDAHEGRDVATADVAGAYLKADMDDFVIMKFTNESVDMLCELNPSHKFFVVQESENKVLYVRLKKALYGCVKSALLWYDLFSTTLQGMGFTLNPYDGCVANKTINGSQCTILWYVEDAKISHLDPNVVKSILGQLENKFDKMTITRGKEHVFLGMAITYNANGTATISMKKYLEEAISESNMEINKPAPTPATRALFEVDDSAKILDKNEAELFHRIVAKLLYVSIRARMDILLPVGFLCTRVSKSTEQDKEKLKRVLQYIHHTKDLVYTLGADRLTTLRTWVDASYAVHPDMKSHTGGIMSFGTGGFVAKSTKQKLNTKSSTEAELVGAGDYLPHTIWVKLFMEQQGHPLSENYLEQDNESAIKMETNGRTSAGPRSRHIDIKYFWIKDRTVRNDITIRHCPTLDMLADFFTKPLQGSMFNRFRDVILGYKHVSHLSLSPELALEERVDMKRAESATASMYMEDDVNDDGFTLVKQKTKAKKAGEYKKSMWSPNVLTKGREYDKITNNVSKDHSFETIQLAK